MVPAKQKAVIEEGAGVDGVEEATGFHETRAELPCFPNEPATERIVNEKQGVQVGECDGEMWSCGRNKMDTSYNGKSSRGPARVCSTVTDSIRCRATDLESFDQRMSMS